MAGWCCGWWAASWMKIAQTVVDPAAITRYPLMLEYKDGLVTIANYDGFKTKFIGSWDMPFASYRISDALTKDGQFAHDR